MIITIDRERYTTQLALPNEYWDCIEEDRRSTTLTTFDFATLQIVDGLQGSETFLVGEKFLQRLKFQAYIRLDAGFQKFFLDNQEIIPVEWAEDRMPQQRMPTQIYFDGSVLLGREGERCAIGIQLRDGRWKSVCRRYENHRSRFRTSIVTSIQ
jgi:hypothetical protein